MSSLDVKLFTTFCWKNSPFLCLNHKKQKQKQNINKNRNKAQYSNYSISGRVLGKDGRIVQPQIFLRFGHIHLKICAQ